MKRLAIVLLAALTGVSCTTVSVDKAQSAADEKTIAEEALIDSLWKWELECPFPHYAMSRQAIGIDADKNYTFAEKTELIYRAHEIRRGYALVKKAYSDKRLKNGRPMLMIPFGTDDFLDSPKCKQMVDYLSRSKVGVRGLVDYLVEQEKQRANKDNAPIVWSALDEMAIDEKVAWLYNEQQAKIIQYESRKNRQKTRGTRAKVFGNVQGQPPVKPFRVKR